LRATHNLAADADDPFLARHAIARQVAVVLLMIGRGHQHLHILAETFFGPVTEQALAGGVEDLDRAFHIDDDDPIDGYANQRPEESVRGRRAGHHGSGRLIRIKRPEACG
jgi:hypothetical protein